jgi:hypothetical protein
MGRIFKQYFEDDQVIVCINCKTHLIPNDNVKYINGMDLYGCTTLPLNINKVINNAQITYVGKQFDFIDLRCNDCSNDIGWIAVYGTNEKYSMQLIYVMSDRVKKIENNS